jgi:hypothetical protein
MDLNTRTIPVDVRDDLVSGGARHGQPTRALRVGFVVDLLRGQGIKVGLERSGAEGWGR